MNSILPTINASLNGLAAVLLLVGYVLMKQKKITAHRNFMVAAGVTSAIFLACYVVYHISAGSVKFKGEGIARPIYFTILFTHVILAAAIAVMVPMTFWRAFKQNVEGHKKIARVTFPIWLYVSITGVVIYVMLYHMYPSA
jgi:uncharacterized membrane protein YozB (DUF420 family)